ncbi:MAG: T9SS type A sorting domain-containing protein [Bacteroidales bacterium]|nr:T9SS type A sorting domain-containing protein [Bacteroidales bacterium]MCF8457538.1 T9SS type A sorting domain-containing protein [Bacteroidales bacterium]
MKKNILIFLLFLSAPFISNAQIQSSPVIPAELLSNYEKDVHSLALGRIYTTNAPAMNEIEIPNAYTDTIWDAMAAVFNAWPIPERDTVFDIECVHKYPYYPFYEFTSDIVIESNYPLYVNAWDNGQTTTGDPAIDTILTNYGFTNVYNFAFGGWVNVYFQTSQYINTQALCSLLLSLPYISTATPGDGSFGSPNKDIHYSKDEDYQYLGFVIRWGDCPTGCTDAKSWNFRVSSNFVVEFTGITQTPPVNTYVPFPTNCNISVNIPLFSLNQLILCEGDSVFLNNQWYFGPTAFNDTLISSQGTDSIVYNSIHQIGTVQTVLDVSICEGDSFNFNGQYLDSSGNYSSVYQAISGCDSLVVLNLEILQLPEIQFSPAFQDSIAQDAGLVYLDFASPVGGVYSGDGISLGYLDPQVLVPGPSWVYYSYTDSISGCGNADSLLIQIIEVNDIEANNHLYGLKLFPNPSTGIIQIHLEDKLTKTAHIEIFNAQGSKIMAIETDENNSQINLQDFPSGIYLLRLEVEELISLHKLVLE